MVLTEVCERDDKKEDKARRHNEGRHKEVAHL